MVDEVRGLFADALADRLQGAELGDLVQVVAEGRTPAGLDKIEPGRPG